MGRWNELITANYSGMRPLVAHCAVAMFRQMGMIYWLERPRLKRANSDRQSAMTRASFGVRFEASKTILAPSPRLPDLAPFYRRRQCSNLRQLLEGKRTCPTRPTSRNRRAHDRKRSTNQSGKRLPRLVATRPGQGRWAARQFDKVVGAATRQAAGLPVRDLVWPRAHHRGVETGGALPAVRPARRRSEPAPIQPDKAAPDFGALAEVDEAQSDVPQVGEWSSFVGVAAFCI